MTWEMGIIIIAVSCFLLSYFLLRVKNYGMRAVLVLLGSYLMASLLYWGVAVFEGVTSQHSSWEGIFIHPWAVSGVVGMLVGLFVFTRLKKSREGDA
jgi:hypothetical protein